MLDILRRREAWGMSWDVFRSAMSGISVVVAAPATWSANAAFNAAWPCWISALWAMAATSVLEMALGPLIARGAWCSRAKLTSGLLLCV